ncbi:hypothetical protein B5S33_g3149 [[Candida] boidinii]|nr:hypothetical protein B5S30_g3336 [[Candida] boidinii]OWB84502.1 hypothetical protein B5S33_g3149 [[Candida] boidinii]
MEIISIDSPDKVIDFIKEELCVADNTGLHLDEIYSALRENLGPLDDFYQKLVFSYILKIPGVSVFKGKDEITNKQQLKKISKEEIDELLFKIDEDSKSLYLSFVPKSQNIIGEFPYELLRYIAKSKSKGITSPELAKISGQDPRSFTSRLAYLESNNLIKKIPYVDKSISSYILVHTRYINDFKVDQIGTNKAAILEMIINELQKAPNNVRVISDLKKELKFETRLKSRRFQRYLRILGRLGYIRKVLAEHEETTKTFHAIQLIKDVSNKESLDELKSETLKEEIENTEDDPNDKEDEDEEEEEEIDIQNSKDKQFSIFNLVFPIANQILSLTAEKKEAGFPATDLITKLTGKLSSKHMYKVLLLMTSEKVREGDGRYLILRGYDFKGKTKFLRYIIQNDFLKSKDLPVEIQDDGFKKLESLNSKSLVDLSLKEFATSVSRFAGFLLPNGNPAFYWYGYKGPIISALAKNKLKITYPRQTVDSNESKAIVINKEKNHSIAKRYKEKQDENRIKLSAAAIAAVAKHEESLKNLENSSDTNKKKDSPEILDGVSFLYSKREKALVKIVDEANVVYLGKVLIEKLTKELDVEHTIDRKTIVKMLKSLHERKLVVVERVERRPVPATMIKSVSFPPTPEQIEGVLKAVRAPWKVKDSHDEKELFRWSDKPIIKSDIQFYETPEILNVLRERMELRKQKRLKRLASKRSGGSRGAKSKPDASLDKPLKFRRKRRRSAASIKAEKSSQVSERDVLWPLIKKRKKKRVNIRDRDDPSSETKGRSPYKPRKVRRSQRFELKHAVFIARAAVITQSLSMSGSIDWFKISKILGDPDLEPTYLKRSWPAFKKIVGGKGLKHIRLTWEEILFKAISAKIVKEEDLIDCNLESLMKLWKEINIEELEPERSRLVSDIKLIRDDFEFKPNAQASTGTLFKFGNTLSDREYNISQSMFIESKEDTNDVGISETNGDKITNISDDNTVVNQERMKISDTKTLLKALFATSAKDFSFEKSNKILSQLDEKICTQAILELQLDNTIAFLGKLSLRKFALTEKVISSLSCKFNERFLKDATMFHDLLDSAAINNKGIILSEVSPEGTFVPIFTLLLDNKIRITRIDQDVSITNDTYSTRTTDKSKMESDFILSATNLNSDIKKISIKLGQPCSRMWIDLNGNLNNYIWKKCITTVLQFIFQTPGVTRNNIVKYFDPLLASYEVTDILDWLSAKNSIKLGENNGYWSGSDWYLTLNT